jgi:hypothetical protein
VPFLSKRGLLLLLVPGVALLLGVLATTAMENEEKSSQLVELRAVQAAVIAMMVDNDLNQLPNPLTEPTADMRFFPDAVTSPFAKGLSPLAKAGYVLRDHQKAVGEDVVTSLHYISIPHTQWTYTVTPNGTVTQGGHR